MCVDQPDFMRIVLLTEFLSSAQIPDDAASFTRVRDNLHRRAQACIRNHDMLNIVSNNCKYGSCGFCFDFSFHLVFTLNITRFCGCV
jgi:hypothetical protein